METRYIGKNVDRPDAIDSATGKLMFCAEKRFPDMLYAKTFRSTQTHAEVLEIDVSKAAQLEGVVAVATAEDLPGVNIHGIHALDQPVLVPVGGKVRLPGEPIAVVAAESIEIAEKALELIEVKYKPLEVLSDPELACLESSPQVHDKRIVREYEYSIGDVERAFSEADVVLEYTQHLSRQEHAYIETEAGISFYDSDGILTLFAPAQEPFNTRQQVARALAIPESKVRAKVPNLGGSFGGKQSMTVQIHTALLTYMTKRPVQMIWTREESMLFSTKRHPGRFYYKIGATKEGMITSMLVDFLLDAGAYADQTPGVVVSAGATAIGPYFVPNIKVYGKGVYTNNPISGAFRGYGGPQATISVERAIDLLADKLGIDRVEIRRKNGLKTGDKPGNAVMVLDSRVTLNDTIEQALAMAGPKPMPSGKNKKVGRGIACCMPQFDVSAKPYNGLTGAGAEVELLVDGSVQVRTGVVEMGSGIKVALAMIAAEELVLDMNKVDVVLSDSMLTPKAGPTVASRAMYCCGNAVKAAAIQLKDRVNIKAAEIFQVPKDLIIWDNGKVYAQGKEDQAMKLSELARLCYVSGTNLVSSIFFVGTHAHLGHSFCTAVADVEVDEETGEVEVLFLGTSHDVGKMINPIGVKSQILGGGVQGMGWALMEDMKSENGQIIPKNLHEYPIPTANDIPKRTEIGIIEDPYPTGPYGAKGIGEHTNYTSTPAILNAIADAVQISLDKFPATPETVWRAMKNRQSDAKPLATCPSSVLEPSTVTV